MKTTLCFLALFTLIVSTSTAQETKYSFKEGYGMTLPAQLTVSTSDGNINVVSSPGNDIEVFFIARRANDVLKISREELEKELIVETTHQGSNLKIVVRNRDERSINFFRDDIDVSFEIHVPQKTACILNTSDGNIAVSGITGNQQLKSSDGDIRIDDITGNVTTKTSDGDISVDRVKGSVEARTSDGHIEVSKVIGDVDTSTSDGNITLSAINGDTSSKTSDGYITFKELSGSFTGVSSDGNIRGNLLQLKNQLNVRTGDGNIDITIPGNLGLDLDIKGESLNVPLNNFSGHSDEESIRGKSNGGGIPVNLSTSDGRVVLAFK
jgi:hypothetical protein